MVVGANLLSWSGVVVLGGDGEVTGGAEKDGKWRRRRPMAGCRAWPALLAARPCRCCSVERERRGGQGGSARAGGWDGASRGRCSCERGRRHPGELGAQRTPVCGACVRDASSAGARSCASVEVSRRGGGA